MPGFIGFPEILLLGLVVLLVFGPKRLPEMGRSLGHGLREFKDSVTNDDDKRLEVPQAVIAEPVSFAHVDDQAGEHTPVAGIETQRLETEQHVA
jgi:sec-independent protein translocase protein TatA